MFVCVVMLYASCACQWAACVCRNAVARPSGYMDQWKRAGVFVCRNAVCVVRLSVRCVFARVCRNAVARLSGYMDLVKAGRYVFVS